MKIIGVLPVYEESDWIEYAVKGIVDFVDVLIIAEGYQGPPWDFWGNRSRDGTLEILDKLEKQYSKIKRINCAWGIHVNLGRANTYNRVLRVIQKLGFLQEDNWCFIVDADEFYTRGQLLEIRSILKKTDKDLLFVYDRMFIYNFRYFILASHGRLIRITKGMKFKAAQKPCYKDGTFYYARRDNVGYILKEHPMFHYSFVRTTDREIKRRRMEYKGGVREKWIFDWIDKVYLGWTANNVEKIYKKNRAITGFPGMLLDDSARKIKIYNGKHPKVLDDHPYRDIEDIRKLTPRLQAHSHITTFDLIENTLYRFLVPKIIKLKSLLG